ncbi:RloB family protein [Kitasatospora sp. NPDC096140]|uniref:RloB family protein n=1 Tax=Kitasatospora sp. NPDC096140 TaxID=3155425 RepID=UPI00331D8A55
MIVTEGIKTEPQYFEGLARHLNSRAIQVISVRPVGLGKDPLSVVKEAVTRRAREQRAGDPFDATWCAVDVDNHQSLEAACSLARKEGVSLAISNPCFEIWLLWHFADQTTWIAGAEAFARLKERHGFSGKNLPEAFPFSTFENAIGRAMRCESTYVPHRPPNPHSSVALLADVLRQSSMRR